MELVLTDPAKADLAYWKKSGNIKVQNRITNNSCNPIGLQLLLQLNDDCYLDRV